MANKDEIEIDIHRRIGKIVCATMPASLYEHLFRTACDWALNGNKEAAQWVVDELIVREREERRLQYDAIRTDKTVTALFYGKPCVSCGKPANSIDHIIPLVKGGTNDMSNLQPMCQSCNSKKSDS